jgi:hypothetical protein
MQKLIKEGANILVIKNPEFNHQISNITVINKTECCATGIEVL